MLYHVVGIGNDCVLGTEYYLPKEWRKATEEKPTEAHKNFPLFLEVFPIFPKTIFSAISLTNCPRLWINRLMGLHNLKVLWYFLGESKTWIPNITAILIWTKKRSSTKYRHWIMLSGEKKFVKKFYVVHEIFDIFNFSCRKIAFLFSKKKFSSTAFYGPPHGIIVIYVTQLLMPF